VIPIVDYLFRYDRGAFWMGKYAFQYFMMPLNRFTRWALDRFMHTRVMYHALHESGQAQRYIIQDIAIPYPAGKQFIEYVDKSRGFYPLWLCPLNCNHRLPMNPHSAPDSTKLLNVGVWGPGPTDYGQVVDVNRKLEKRVLELSGMKWLYAHTYYTEEEFWRIYDRKWYDTLRAKYDATSLLSVYDKVKVNADVHRKMMSGVWAIWPISGVYATFRAAAARDRRTQAALSLSILISLYAAIMFGAPSLYILIFLVLLTRSRKVGLLTVLASLIHGFYGVRQLSAE
jgi:hypothetical protein